MFCDELLNDDIMNRDLSVCIILWRDIISGLAPVFLLSGLCAWCTVFKITEKHITYLYSCYQIKLFEQTQQ